jgi:predicted DNA-binding ribbon-helix-helix protein
VPRDREDVAHSRIDLSSKGREAAMKSPVVKRSVMIGSHKTSVSLEEAFWDGLKEISRERGKTLSELVSEIDDRRQQGNLSSAIRLFVLDHFMTGAAGRADVPKSLHAEATNA